MGSIVGISARIKKRAPMDVFYAAKVSFAGGVGDDSRGKLRNHRQVTLMAQESWNEVSEEMGKVIHWTTRRANILIEGIDLKDTTGEYLKLGEIILKITGELEPCGRMDEQYDGLTKALTPNWRGGVTCEIIREGQIMEGDRIVFVDPI
ncbi:MAG: MOSC domain-containing protein [Crocinitomicaceae bacterium]|nr:MOSC domain-containing protein [Crocinitomicaceae bacterium]